MGKIVIEKLFDSIGLGFYEIKKETQLGVKIETKKKQPRVRILT